VIFGLIRVDPALLIGLFDLLAFALFADQSPGAETQSATNCSATESADADAFFPAW
jgi:hypothetical protein